MGFSTTFQDLIYRLICNIWYRVNVNVFLREKFRSTRGVRQGDLVLPFLFIIAQQIISFNIRKLEARGLIIPYKMGRNVNSISHLFYADNMLLFTNGRKSSIKQLMLLLKDYDYLLDSKSTWIRVGFIIPKGFTGAV